MMEKIPSKPEQVPTHAIEEDFDKLLDLVGVDDSVLVANAVESLKAELADLPKVGASLESQEVTNRPEFVIPLFSAEQKERLIEILYDLGIYPWEENKLLIIEHKKDLQKLKAAGIISSYLGQEAPPPPKTVTGHEPEFPFPMKAEGDISVFPKRSGSVSSKRGEISQDTELVEIDQEIREMVAKFDLGLVDDDDNEFVRVMGNIPTLKLFPRQYVWEKGNLYHARSGEIIPREEMDKWLSEAKAGDEKRLETLVRVHAGFVLQRVALAKKRYPMADADDLFQEGLLGLVTGIEGHDPEKGKLLSYATYWIDQRILRFAFRYNKQIHRPTHISGNIHKVYKEEKAATSVSGEIDYKELGQELHGHKQYGIVSEARLDALKRHLLIGSKFNPLDESFESSNESEVDMQGEPLHSPYKADAVEEQETLRGAIDKVLMRLTPKEERVLRLRFGLGRSPKWGDSKFVDGLSLDETGEQLGVSRERVRQLEARALRRLHHPALSRNLRVFFDSDFNTKLWQ